MLKIFDNMTDEQKAEQKEFLNTIIGTILYFVIINNPKKAGLVKVFMRIFGISDDIFSEIEGMMNGEKPE